MKIFSLFFFIVRRRHISAGSIKFYGYQKPHRNSTCLSGDCSLREAVNAANATATDDTISFDSGLTTITLTNEIAVMNGTLTINGTGANVLTIDGGAGYNRIFYTERR